VNEHKFCTDCAKFRPARGTTNIVKRMGRRGEWRDEDR